MPMDEPWPDAVLPNYSKLKSLIDSGDYEQEKYSNKGREAFERIKSDGYFYVPDGFENSEVTVVSGSDSASETVSTSAATAEKGTQVSERTDAARTESVFLNFILIPPFQI